MVPNDLEWSSIGQNDLEWYIMTCTNVSQEIWKSNFRQHGQLEKQRWEESEKRRKKGIHCVFPMVCGSGSWKSRLAKAAGAEPSGQMRDEKLEAVVARNKCPSQNEKAPQLRTTFESWDVEKVHTVAGRSALDKMYHVHNFQTSFGSWDVEKTHAVVARSTFPRQNG